MLRDYHGNLSETTILRKQALAPGLTMPPPRTLYGCMKTRVNVYLDDDQIAVFKAESTMARRSLSEWIAMAADQAALQAMTIRASGQLAAAVKQYTRDRK